MLFGGVLTINKINLNSDLKMVKIKNKRKFHHLKVPNDTQIRQLRGAIIW